MATLLERLTTWIRLFSTRFDVETVEPLVLEPPEDGGDDGPPYPTDAASIAKVTSHIQVQFFLGTTEKTDVKLDLLFNRSLDDPEFDFEDVQEELLEMSGEDACFDDAPFYLLQVDNLGGEHAWYVFPKDGKPVIVWDIAHMALFKSLGDFLKEGATRGFCLGWQREKASSGTTLDHAAPLKQLSWPQSTPLEELKAGLIAQGASEVEADDLIDWLGAAVHLLLPLAEGDPRRTTPDWFKQG